ncbi:phospholipase D C-like [Dorcoceras hygrometricum]|nr:phospholipase D C-like [Dorcoceras hygrometricum]
MENKFGLYGPGSSSTWTWLEKEELQEADVWGAFQEQLEDSISRDKTSYMSKCLIQYPTRSIPNDIYATGAEIIRRGSTPVSIPDWSKIYGTSCSETHSSSCFWLDADSNRDENNRGFARNRWNSDIEEEDYDDGEFVFEESAMIPPHIWIATKIRPSSVCEGAGRTLKGRDLLSVRNAVLTKTGFLESKSNRR